VIAASTIAPAANASAKKPACFHQGLRPRAPRLGIEAWTWIAGFGTAARRVAGGAERRRAVTAAGAGGWGEIAAGAGGGTRSTEGRVEAGGSAGPRAVSGTGHAFAA
jgi:hypothetical protein